MQFVFVTDELPAPGLAGHLALNHAIIAWLRGAGHEVTLLLVRPRLRWPVERYGLAPVAGPGIGMWRNLVFARRPRDIAVILAKYVRDLMPAAPRAAFGRFGRGQIYGNADTVLGAFITPEQSAWCAGRIAQLAPDAVLIDTIFRAAVLREPGLSGLNSVIIAHDVFYLRHRALTAAGYKVHPPVLYQSTEAALLNAAGAIAAIQPEEAALIKAMCPERPVCVTPMPASPCPRLAGAARLPGRLVFAGSASLPNLDGLRWFFAEIWPRLRTWRPDITLDLAGDCGSAFARLPPGVTRLGRVKNLSGVLHTASLAIAPLRVGSGLKIKILDYARHGLITVATPASLQGFASDLHAPFIAAGDAAAFAAAIAAKLENADKADEQHALDYVTRHYGFAKSFSGLARALHIAAPIKDSNFA